MRATIDAGHEVVALFLDNGEHLTKYGIVHGIHKKVNPDRSDEEIRSAISTLKRGDVLVILDPEYDILFGQTLSHNEHGDLSSDDFTFFLDDLYALGPNSPKFIEENVSLFREIASNAGLAAAIERLSQLRIDSASWTGLPSNFRFTAENQAHVIKMLRAADLQLERSGLPNSETAQAKAYVSAALMIAEAPEPQPDLIWEIVQRGGALSSIGQLFLAIIAFFKGAN